MVCIIPIFIIVLIIICQDYWTPSFSPGVRSRMKITLYYHIETFSALLALCAGNSSVTGEFPSQRPMTRSFDVFFDLRLNKWLSKQSGRRSVETPWLSLWRHCNVGCYTNRGWWSLGHSCLWHLIMGINNSSSVPIAIFSGPRDAIMDLINVGNLVWSAILLRH